MQEAARVKHLVFSDLYLGHPTLQDRLCDVPGAAANPLPASPALREDLQRLTALCRQAQGTQRALVRCKISYDGVTYHMTTLLTGEGQVFILRKVADVIHSLAELGVPAAYVRRLLGGGLSGLFVIAGAAKSGKTSTACALVKDRLAAHGGVAITGEDLIELPLEGSYGNGVCYQTATGGGVSGTSLRGILGTGAQIIFLDEIRDQESASEVLRASSAGCLIISTMVADSVTQAVAKLEALAAERMGEATAQTLIAEGLAGVMHQTLLRGHKIALTTEVLFLRDVPQAREVLRSGRYELLASDMDRQMASMISAHAAASAPSL
jgi:twitching motility protein PilT